MLPIGKINGMIERGFTDEPSLNLPLGKHFAILFINGMANPYKV